MSSVTLKFEGVPADLMLQIAQLAATHTAEPMLVSDRTRSAGGQRRARRAHGDGVAGRR